MAKFGSGALVRVAHPRPKSYVARYEGEVGVVVYVDEAAGCDVDLASGVEEFFYFDELERVE